MTDETEPLIVRLAEAWEQMSHGDETDYVIEEIDNAEPNELVEAYRAFGSMQTQVFEAIEWAYLYTDEDFDLTARNRKAVGRMFDQ